MTKINKTLTEDVFKGMKHVDEAFNKAAGINESVNDSFETSLKKRLLKENMNEEIFTPEDEEMPGVDESFDPAFDDNDNEYAFLDSPEEEVAARNWEDEDENFFDDELDESTIGNDVDPMEEELLTEYTDEHEMSTQDALGENTELDEVLFNEATMNEANPFEGGEETPATATEMGTEEIPAEGAEGTEEVPMGDEAGMDMGADASMDSVPGMDMGGAEMPTDNGMEDTGAEGAPVEPSVSLSQPEDIDQLIADIVPADDTITENKELKSLGYKELETQDLTNKVRMENKNRRMVKESSLESKPLENKFGTPSRVKGATEGKAVEHSSRIQPKALTDLGFTILGEDDINSNTVTKASSAVKMDTTPNFTKVVAESKDKSKALVKLAEKYITLEDANKALLFENYKLKSANSVLVLLPEASEATRTKLVKRFSECKSNKEVKAFYEEVANMAKSESSKTKKLNEVASKRSSAIRSISESVETSEDTATEVTEQSRKNFLMGMGDADMYNQGIKY